MPSDPKECRRRARQCSLMANRAASRQEQRTFERNHRSWNKLALEIESALGANLLGHLRNARAQRTVPAP
jgi:hypothetical protein